jgi:hypothetical protein
MLLQMFLIFSCREDIHFIQKILYYLTDFQVRNAASTMGKLQHNTANEARVAVILTIYLKTLLSWTTHNLSGHDKASASTNYAWHDRSSIERAVVHPFIASEPGLNHGVTLNIIGNYSSFDWFSLIFTATATTKNTLMDKIEKAQQPDITLLIHFRILMP